MVDPFCKSQSLKKLPAQFGSLAHLVEPFFESQLFDLCFPFLFSTFTELNEKGKKSEQNR